VQDFKKNELRPHLRKQWVIPPEQNASFVANMEDIPEIYHQPSNPLIPLICMDEQPVQLIGEKCSPIKMGHGSPEKYDYEYRRSGTAEIFMFTEPPAGFRRVSVRESKKGTDWAEEIRELLEKDYPSAEKVILVCDNYSTHKIGSLYEMFPPGHARSLVRRPEIHYTPKHGSWLNIAEIELSSLTRQCLDRRIPHIDILRSETKAWESDRNTDCKSVNWQFTTEDARIKLRRLYPQF